MLHSLITASDIVTVEVNDLVADFNRVAVDDIVIVSVMVLILFLSGFANESDIVMDWLIILDIPFILVTVELMVTVEVRDRV